MHALIDGDLIHSRTCAYLYNSLMLLRQDFHIMKILPGTLLLQPIHAVLQFLEESLQLNALPVQSSQILQVSN